MPSGSDTSRAYLVATATTTTTDFFSMEMFEEKVIYAITHNASTPIREASDFCLERVIMATKMRQYVAHHEYTTNSTFKQLVNRSETSGNLSKTNEVGQGGIKVSLKISVSKSNANEVSPMKVAGRVVERWESEVERSGTKRAPPCRCLAYQVSNRTKARQG
jgi:hypothetical protein